MTAKKPKRQVSELEAAVALIGKIFGDDNVHEVGRGRWCRICGVKLGAATNSVSWPADKMEICTACEGSVFEQDEQEGWHGRSTG